MNNASVADTIIEQLGGFSRLQTMIGAKNFAYDSNSVQFKFPNRRGPNYVKITLDSDDTYTVDFGRVVKYNIRNLRKFHGVGVENLREVFEAKTGLYLFASFPRKLHHSMDDKN